MRKSALLLSLAAAFLMGCGGSQVDCPPGAILEDWQIIANNVGDYDNRGYLSCPRQITAEVEGYGGVWGSSRKPDVRMGSITLSATIENSCSEIQMSVGKTTSRVDLKDGRYSLTATVREPFLVGIGAINYTDTFCKAIIEKVQVQLDPPA